MTSIVSGSPLYNTAASQQKAGITKAAQPQPKSESSQMLVAQIFTPPTLEAAIGRLAVPQTSADTQLLGSSDSAGKSAVDEFLEFTEMSWEEKIRAMILKSMGLREEDLANMTPEELEKIEARIKERIEQEIEKKTGMAGDSATGTAQGA